MDDVPEGTKEYVANIIELLKTCHDVLLLDLIYKLLKH